MLRHTVARHSLLLFGLATGCPDNTKTTVDEDGDGSVEDVDCDDNDPDIHPGAFDACGDLIDADCDLVDPVCSNDLDGDGYDASDDCDDADAAVHPDAAELCTDEIDNDCDGISTACLDPSLIYEATDVIGGVIGTAVFADRILFGQPNAFQYDGRVVGFTLQEGVVSELDAQFVAPGVVGREDGMGRGILPYDDVLCIGTDTADASNLDYAAGHGWCFDEATIASAAGTLALSSAQYDVAGTEREAGARVLGEQEVNGDGISDLVVGSGYGIYVAYGSGAAWAGSYTVPTDVDTTLGDCAADPSFYCGFGSAIAPTAIAVSGRGGDVETISIYRLPITSDPPVPDASYELYRNPSDLIVPLHGVDGFAIASSPFDEVHFVDIEGNLLETLDASGAGGFGYSLDTFVDGDGHEQLLVAEIAMETDGEERGGVYVFDITEHGFPSSPSEAEYILTAPPGYDNCGYVTRGGTIVDAYTSNTVVTVSCSSGGLAYVIASSDLPPPPIPPSKIQQTGPNAWSIKRSVIDTYAGNPAWVQTLAQTRQVKQGNQVVGWRLFGIDPGSPLYRAGLRSGDLVKAVNDTAVTTPAVVRHLATSLAGAGVVSLRIQRGAALRTITYTIVP